MFCKFWEFDGTFRLLPTLLHFTDGFGECDGCFEPKGSVLLTWEIMGVLNPEELFQSLSERRIKPKISAKLSQEDAENMTVEKCYVGHTKNLLDVTDLLC